MSFFALQYELFVVVSIITVYYELFLAVSFVAVHYSCFGWCHLLLGIRSHLWLCHLLRCNVSYLAAYFVTVQYVCAVSGSVRQGELYLAA